jgi:hypothetical protein
VGPGDLKNLEKVRKSLIFSNKVGVGENKVKTCNSRHSLLIMKE